MNVDSQDLKDLKKIDKRVKVNEVSKVRLKARPINVKVTALGKEEQKLVKKWSSKCAEPLREFCTSVLTRLLTYFTSKSVDNILSEATRKGLSLEIILILLSQYDLVNNDDTLIKNYLNTGNVDMNILVNILLRNGVNIKPEELNQFIQNKDKTKREEGLISKLLKH